MQVGLGTIVSMAVVTVSLDISAVLQVVDQAVW